MAQGKITLYYMCIKGRGEIARLLLHAAEREFEDVRFSYTTSELPDFKPNSPYGQVPVLEIDGKRYGQSHAINRFLADELGFSGKTNLENFTINAVAGLFEDAFRAFINVSLEPDDSKKPELLKKAVELRAKINGFLEKMLKENGTGYFVGDRLTLADIYAYDMSTGSMGEAAGPPDDSCPMLKANIEKVKSNPGIAKYIASK